jgi:hypothetical protein
MVDLKWERLTSKLSNNLFPGRSFILTSKLQTNKDRFAEAADIINSYRMTPADGLTFIAIEQELLAAGYAGALVSFDYETNKLKVIVCDGECSQTITI